MSEEMALGSNGLEIEEERLLRVCGEIAAESTSGLSFNDFWGEEG
jgi:hypothetical protein